MKKKTVKLILSAAALAVLCGTYFGVKAYVDKQEKKESSEEDNNVNIVSLQEADIQSLKFMIDKNEVTFKRDSDKWIKDDEKGFPVDQDKLDSAAGAVSSVDAERELDEAAHLSEYGLDSPSNTVTIQTKDGAETVLNIGDKNESTGQYYVSKGDDDKTVYVITSSAIDPFMSSLYDYAKGDAFPSVDSSAINRIEVNGTHSSYTLENDKDIGFWNIIGDSGEEKADSAAASALSSSVSSMAYAAFIDYNSSDPSEYGLDKPYAEITIDYEEEQEADTAEGDESIDGENEGEEDAAEDSAASEIKDSDSSEESSLEEGEKDKLPIQKELTINIGDQAEDGTRYVQLSDSKEVYTMSDDTLSAFLEKDESSFWDLTVNYLSVNDLNSLNVEYNNESHIIDVVRETVKQESEKEDSDKKGSETADTSDTDKTVTTYQLDGKDTDETVFTTFYNKLINMAGQKRMTENFETKTKPELTVTFADTDKNTVKVEFYSYDSNFYAAVVEDKVYLVNKMNVKEMINAYEKLIGTGSSTEN